MAKEAKKVEEKAGIETPAKVSKARTLVSGAGFHDFDEQPEFEGIFSGETVIAENDDEKQGRKKGDIMGYLFEGEEGETIIGASHSITKAVEQIVKGDRLLIKFLGKQIKGNGKPFNRFKIDLLD